MTGTDQAAAHRTPLLFDVAAGVLLSGSVLVLLILPTTLFTSSLRTVLLVLVAGHLALRLWARLRGLAPESGADRLQEWIQVAALAGVLLTLAPMSLNTTHLHGSTRYEQNLRVSDAIAQSESLELTSDAHKYGQGYAFTRNKAGTIRVLLTLLLMHAAFLTARRIQPTHRHLQLWLLAGFGTAVAAAGVISRHMLPQGQTLWWIYPIFGTALPGPISGFINPNHFAGYVALLTPVALALSVVSFARRRLLRGLVGLAMAAVMAGGLLAAHSRGGLGAFVLGVAATGTLCLVRGRVLAGLFIAAVIAAMAFGLPTFMSDTYRERLGYLHEFKDDDSYRTRMQAWADSRDIVGTYPALGAGANAFRMVYPQSRTDSTQARMTHAENEYVQLLTDFGILGALGFLIIVALTVHSLLPGVRALRARLDAPTLAAGGVLCVVASHAMVDFALHIPVYALTAAILIGLGAPPRATHAPAPSFQILAPCLALVLSCLCVFTWGKRQHVDSSQHIRRAGYNKLCRAMRWAPTSPQAWRRLGSRAVREDALDARMFGEACLTQAGTYDPMDYTLWYEIGLARIGLGDYRGAREAQLHVQSLKDWYWPEDIVMP